jgi:hypothetical protein
MDKNTIEKPERNKVKIVSLLPGKTNITLFCEKTCENSKYFLLEMFILKISCEKFLYNAKKH